MAKRTFKLTEPESRERLLKWLRGEDEDQEPELSSQQKRLEQQMAEAIEDGFLSVPQIPTTQPVGVWWTGVAVQRSTEDWLTFDHQVLPQTGVKPLYFINCPTYRAPLLFLDGFYSDVVQAFYSGVGNLSTPTLRTAFYAARTLHAPGRPRQLLKSEKLWLPECREPWRRTDPANLAVQFSGLSNDVPFLYQLFDGRWYLASTRGIKWGNKVAYLLMPRELYDEGLLYDIVKFWLLVAPEGVRE